MRTPIILLLSFTFLFLTPIKVYPQKALTREQLLEEALIIRYLPFLLETTEKLFMCEKITDIKRLNENNNEHELTIEVVTFEQAHSPPYNLVRVTLSDTSKGIVITKVDREENLSDKQFNKHCEK